MSPFLINIIIITIDALDGDYKRKEVAVSPSGEELWPRSRQSVA